MDATLFAIPKPKKKLGYSASCSKVAVKLLLPGDSFAADYEVSSQIGYIGERPDSALFQVQGDRISEHAIFPGINAVSPLQAICPDDHGFTIHYRAAQADQKLIILIGKAFDVELFISKVLVLQLRMFGLQGLLDTFLEVLGAPCILQLGHVIATKLEARDPSGRAVIIIIVRAVG